MLVVWSESLSPECSSILVRAKVAVTIERVLQKRGGYMRAFGAYSLDGKSVVSLL